MLSIDGPNSRTRRHAVLRLASIIHCCLFGRDDLSRSGFVNHPHEILLALMIRKRLEGYAMSLEELRDRISEDQITRDDVIDALRQPLTNANDASLRSKLRQAITSANIYYSSCKWGHARTLERAKARLIADITKAAA